MTFSAEQKSAFKEELKGLLQVYTSSGGETPMLEYLYPLTKPYCEEVYEDNFGSLICHVGGKGKKLLITAHIDEVGFIVKSIDKNGFIFFQKFGGIPEKQLEARQVIINGKIPGVIGCKPGHLQTPQEQMQATPINQLFVDIGASSREDVEALGIEVGSFFSMQYNYTELTFPDMIYSRSLDDRVGCALLLGLMKTVKKEDLKYDLYLGFTLQEETGLRGAQAMANCLEPDYAISVDTVPCADTPFTNYERDLPLELGKGFCLSLTESRVAYASPRMLKQVRMIQQATGIPMQTASTTGMAGTDSAIMSVSGKGTQVCTMTIPRRYSHTQVELMNINDALALGEMLKAFATTEHRFPPVHERM